MGCAGARGGRAAAEIRRGRWLNRVLAGGALATSRDRLGHPLTRERTQAVAAAIAARYAADGYARPELRQDIALAGEGILRINVFEPHIARVTIEGTPGRHRGAIERIAAGLLEARPLRRNDIPAALAAMRQLRGLTVKATTRPEGKVRNAHELVLQAEFAPFAGVARMNNRGTDQVGRLFVLGQVEANDLFGWNEQLGFVFAAATDTDEYRSGGLYLDTPLGVSGTRGMLMLFRSDSAPNEAPVNLADEYLRERVTLRFSHPLRQTADRSLTLSGALEAEDLEVDRNGTVIRDDRLRVLEAGLRTTWRAWDATQFSSTFEIRHGLDALGSGLRADDLPVDPRSVDFLLAQLQLTSFTRLGTTWSLRVDGYAQYSADVLPDGERFKIGGERLGRGFEVAEIAGDRGLGAKLLLRRELPGTATAWGRFSAYGFYDIGAAWKQDIGGRESAATLGAGAALHGTWLSGSVEVAKPMTPADVEGKRSTLVFAELSVRF
jgi:hemolysin activation/secretion protein